MKPYLTLSVTFALPVNTLAISSRAENQPPAGKTGGAIVVWTTIAGF